MLADLVPPLALAILLASTATHADAGATREVLAWITPDDASVKSFTRVAANISIVSPVLHRIDWANGSPRLAAWSNGSNKLGTRFGGVPPERVFPLVSCLGQCGKRISEELADATKRDRLVQIVKEAAEGRGGVLIDFEDLRCNASDLSTFVRDLGVELRRAGKRLALAVPPPCPAGIDKRASPETRTSVCVHDGSSYDFASLTRDADIVAVMVYDHDTSGERPPQPRKWTEGVVARLAALVPTKERSKILMGIPLYGRMSANVDGRTDVLYGAAMRGSVHGTRVTTSGLAYDSEALATVGSISSDADPAKRGRLYLETHSSFRERASMATSHGFGGIAMWRLGDEDPCIKTVLESFRTRGATNVPCAVETAPAIKPSAR